MIDTLTVSILSLGKVLRLQTRVVPLSGITGYDNIFNIKYRIPIIQGPVSKTGSIGTVLYLQYLKL